MNAALTPLVESSWDESDSPLVSEEMQKKCMMVNGCLQYITKFRSDIHYTVMEIGCRIRQVTEKTLAVIKRLLRYLHGTRGWALMIKNEGKLYEVYSESDTNWAGCKQSRRSTSSCRITVGGSTAYSVSYTHLTLPTTNSV